MDTRAELEDAAWQAYLRATEDLTGRTYRLAEVVAFQALSKELLRLERENATGRVRSAA